MNASNNVLAQLLADETLRRASCENELQELRSHFDKWRAGFGCERTKLIEEIEALRALNDELARRAAAR